MKQKKLIRLIAAIISVCVLFTSFTVGTFYSFAAETESSSESTTETTTSAEQAKEEAKKALENQKKELENNLKASEEKLALLASQSKNTEEYINALDEKIGYLNEQLTLLDAQVVGYEEDIDILQQSIDSNQQQADVLQKDVDEAQRKIDELTLRFQSKYDAYCIRIRAIYISGSYNILTALLTCGDISSFLTRYEMIKAVSKSDAQLLASIEEETNKIIAQEADLSEKRNTLDDIKMALLAQKNELVSKQQSLAAIQLDQANKKIILSQDRAESDKLFAELTAQNGMYTEFRNEDKSVIAAVEDEIQSLISGVKKPEDVTLGTTSDRTNTTVSSDYSYSDIYSKSDAVLNMTYPVPGYYTVSAGFPNYSNGSYHGGIDYPCPSGSKVVAAQSGVVIGAKNLDNSYGHYILIYHGTDSKGRSVVTLYGHNSEILVHVGQNVSRGQQIAKSGSTGNSTGPHCHFEIRLDGERANPKNYLSK